MSDTPPIPSAPAVALLDAAASSAAKPSPRFRMVRANLPNLLHSILAYASPAGQHLDAAIRDHVERESCSADEAVRTVAHHQVITEWCAANPAAAASVVLCAIYLANGRIVAQEEVAPPELGPLRDGPATDEPREQVEAPADGAPVSIAGPSDAERVQQAARWTLAAILQKVGRRDQRNTGAISLAQSLAAKALRATGAISLPRSREVKTSVKGCNDDAIRDMAETLAEDALRAGAQFASFVKLSSEVPGAKAVFVASDEEAGVHVRARIDGTSMVIDYTITPLPTGDGDLD